MAVRILKLLVSVSVYLWDRAISSILKLSGTPRKGRCAVLYYHSVKDQERHRFGRHMDILLQEARPVPPDSIPPMKPGTSYVAITFDDGFDSVKRNAIPELVLRNIPCMIFVPSANLGKAPIWLQGTGHLDCSDAVISSQDVKELSNNRLVRIGSHGRTHENYLQLDERGVLEEIRKSKEELELVTGRRIRSLSFPHGRFKKELVELAEKEGYTHVFSISPEPVYGDELLMGRFRADPWDWDLEFRMKLHCAYRWTLVTSRIKRRLIGSFTGSVHAPPKRNLGPE
jgi:peptidoglycan/xylan/chitin deacetylase (PgdA/CDA1 family)